MKPLSSEDPGPSRPMRRPAGVVSGPPCHDKQIVLHVLHCVCMSRSRHDRVDDLGTSTSVLCACLSVACF